MEFSIFAENMQHMEELKEIYDRMTFLRQKGIKMKEMAEKAGFTPSVLSAIYSTVSCPPILRTERRARTRMRH